MQSSADGWGVVSPGLLSASLGDVGALVRLNALTGMIDGWITSSLSTVPVWSIFFYYAVRIMQVANTSLLSCCYV